MTNQEIDNLKKRAEQNEIEALLELAEIYEDGMEVEQNLEEAVRLYRLAAHLGNAEAQENLGRMYQHGLGVTQDDTEAVRLYRLAADQKDKHAQFSLGLMYQKGRGVEQNDDEAVKLYRLSADQNNKNAQFSLGLMYQEGRGVEQNDTEAVQWIKRSAEQGKPEAQLHLAQMYLIGHGVEQNDEEAVLWLRKSAEQDYAGAQYTLGLVYLNGWGVESLYEESLRWFKLAAKQNHVEAQEKLEDIQKISDLIEKHKQKQLKEQVFVVQIDGVEQVEGNGKESAASIKIQQLKNIISQINNNIRGTDKKEKGIFHFDRCTHDTEGPKIKTLEVLATLLDERTFNEKELEVILKISLGLYQVKRHKYGFFPHSAKEFKNLLKGTSMELPKEPITFTTEKLQSWLKQGNAKKELLNLIVNDTPGVTNREARLNNITNGNLCGIAS